MSAEVSCTECKQKMVDNVMEHLPTCSVTIMQPITFTLEARGPGMTIKFDTPEEQAEWFSNLSGGSTNTKSEGES